MAPEIHRNGNQIAPGLGHVASTIATAAESQPAELIVNALKSFASVAREQSSYDANLSKAIDNKVSMADAAFVDAPLEYLAAAGPHVSGFRSVVSMGEVMANLRRQDLNFHDGIAAFLKSGIQEALSGLKIVPNPGIQAPPIAQPLDELLTPAKLKNPDRAQLQSSIRVVNALFSTLKGLRNSNSEIQVSMMRFIRA